MKGLNDFAVIDIDVESQDRDYTPKVQTLTVTNSSGEVVSVRFDMTFDTFYSQWTGLLEDEANRWTMEGEEKQIQPNQSITFDATFNECDDYTQWQLCSGYLINGVKVYVDGKYYQSFITRSFYR